MIGAAVLQKIAADYPAVFSGASLFYEKVELNARGEMPDFAVTVFTNSAPIEPNGDYHQYLEFWVDVSENVERQKAKADAVVKTITDAIRDWLDWPDIMSRIVLTERSTGEKFNDVRLFPSSSKQRGTDLQNGAITKVVIGEVFYK